MWRTAVRAIYEMGGTASTRDIELAGLATKRLRDAKGLGLVEHGPWRGSGIECLWWLTPRGIDWCEGRVSLTPKPWPGGPGRPGYRLTATWLSALPRDIRISQGADA